MRPRDAAFALLPCALLVALPAACVLHVWDDMARDAALETARSGRSLLHEVDPLTGYRLADGPRWVPDGPVDVVAVGGSTTYSSETTAAESWPALVGAVNGGVMGYTSWHLLAHTQRLLLEHEPAVVVVYAGWNDGQARALWPGYRADYLHMMAPWGWRSGVALDDVVQRPRGGDGDANARGGSADAAAANFRALWALVRASGAEPVHVLQATDYTAVRAAGDARTQPLWVLRETQAAIVEAADSAGVRVVDPRSVMNDRSELFAGDAVHLSTEGNRALARILTSEYTRSSLGGPKCSSQRVHDGTGEDPYAVRVNRRMDRGACGVLERTASSLGGPCRRDGIECVPSDYGHAVR